MLIRLTTLLVFLLSFFASGNVHAESEVASRDLSASLSGSFKNLLISGETLSGEDFTEDLSRLRLELDMAPAPDLFLKIIFDNEAIIGSVLDTEEFKSSKDASSSNLFRLSSEITDTGDVYWRHSVYRAYLSYSKSRINVRAGRQRINWGQGRLWNPTDLLNPVSPLKVELGEREGVDAISLEYFPGMLTSVNAVYAFANEPSEDSFGLRGGTNFEEFDFYLMAGEFKDDLVVGLEFAGNLRGSGVRGEFTLTDAENGESFARGVLGVDYVFPNTLYVMLEYLYNGRIVPDTSSASIERSAEIITVGKNFIGFGFGYDLTPLARLKLTAIFDVDGKSRFLSPALSYNVIPDLYWTASAQLFGGGGGGPSDFGEVPKLYITSIEWYF